MDHLVKLFKVKLELRSTCKFNVNLMLLFNAFVLFCTDCVSVCKRFGTKRLRLAIFPTDNKSLHLSQI